jgi:DNA-binding response OmpR family regulator
MPAHPSAPVIRFGAFEVNFQTGELRHKGQRVKLQAQPLQILAALLERPGEIVTREELCKKLWSEDTFVDFDHSLNAAIKRLRDALRESAGCGFQPRNDPTSVHNHGRNTGPGCKRMERIDCQMTL